MQVPEWLGPVVRISLGWFGREVSHVGESVQGQRLLTAVRLALVVTAALVAAALPSYGDAVGLMGGFVTTLTAVLLPTALYLAVHVGAAEAGEPPLSPAQLIACALVVLGGLLAMTSALGALLGPLGMLILLLLAFIFAAVLHSLWQAVNRLQVPCTYTAIHGHMHAHGHVHARTRHIHLLMHLHSRALTCPHMHCTARACGLQG